MFHKPEVPFLGRLLSDNGVQPDMEHAKSIKDAPAPTDFKQLKLFLGLVTYYSPFFLFFLQLQSHYVPWNEARANTSGHLPARRHLIW